MSLSHRQKIAHILTMVLYIVLSVTSIITTNYEYKDATIVVCSVIMTMSILGLVPIIMKCQSN